MIHDTISTGNVKKCASLLNLLISTNFYFKTSALRDNLCYKRIRINIIFSPRNQWISLNVNLFRNKNKYNTFRICIVIFTQT